MKKLQEENDKIKMENLLLRNQSKCKDAMETELADAHKKISELKEEIDKLHLQIDDREIAQRTLEIRLTDK
ncbi:hypothetical protein AB6A40_011607 [Gnathostoma spinigerum]|uniref:Uncharacterized protein n=1 Tax=Gnathostoma spinigerum TaxID=75299 RepID=A0ABD6F3T8_9BILA